MAFFGLVESPLAYERWGTFLQIHLPSAAFSELNIWKQYSEWFGILHKWLLEKRETVKYFWHSFIVFPIVLTMFKFQHLKPMTVTFDILQRNYRDGNPELMSDTLPLLFFCPSGPLYFWKLLTAGLIRVPSFLLL